MADSINNTENKRTGSHGFSSQTAGIQFVDRIVKDPGGAIPDDKSYTIWQNAWKTFTKMFKGTWAVNATEDVIINAGNEVHITCHNKQEITTGGDAQYIKGTKVQIHGEKSQKESDNITKHHELLQQVDKKVKETIENTEPEMVKCSNCAQKRLVDDKSDNWVTILNAIQRTVNNIPFLRGPFSAIKFLISKIYAVIPGEKTNLGLNNGKGCGPGCENGMRKGLANKFAAGEKAMKSEMDKISKEMDALAVELSPMSDHADVKKDTYAIIVGDPKNIAKDIPYIKHKNLHHEYPLNARPSTLPNVLRSTTEGAAPKVTYHPPVPSTYGNFLISVANNFKINAGASGVDILSIGEIAIKGGSVHINGSQGEVSLTSSNVTTIGGGNVIISADNKSGDTGVFIDSKHTFVKGAFNVSGDTALMGSLTVDGAIQAPHLICPTMAAPTTQASSDSFSTNGAAWWPAAPVLKLANIGLKTINYGLEPSKLMTPVGILDMAVELIAKARTMAPVDGLTGQAFGWALVPIPFAGIVPCPVLCSPFTAPFLGGVFNFPHVHDTTVGSHRHEVDVPAGSYYKKLVGAGAHRSAGNPAPTMAPANTTFPRPGPASWGGGCGGGGLYSKVRNQKYGINSDDAFNNGNFVITTPVRNPDGSLFPPPDLTHRVINDIGSGSTVDKSGKVTLAPAVTGCD
jgi:hypothetical protein